MPKTILLFAHGGYYNRGCEAIVRSSTAMLKNQMKDVRFILASFDKETDESRGLGLADHIIPCFSPRWSPTGITARAMSRIQPEKGYYWWASAIRRVLPKVDLVLSIGGDHYCGDAAPYLTAVHQLARDQDIPVVLWGASVDVQGASDAKLAELRAFDLITARDTLAIEHLARVGIVDTVRRVADPAFTMMTMPVQTDSFWPKGDGVLGLNLSPLLSQFRNDGDAVLVQWGAKLAQYAIDQLGMGVLLIPHVTQPMRPEFQNNDDLLILKKVYDLAQRPERISIVPSVFNAAETKHIISKCRFFIGGRTHSTIAALSSCVPTISIAYSVKAVGINTDLFGDARYVVHLEQIEKHSPESVMELLHNDENGVHQHLSNVMPSVCSLSLSGARYAGEMLRT